MSNQLLDIVARSLSLRLGKLPYCVLLSITKAILHVNVTVWGHNKHALYALWCSVKWFSWNHSKRFVIGVNLDMSAIDELVSSLKSKDNCQNFLLYIRIARLWLWRRPYSIGKGLTLLDKGSAEDRAARRHHTVWQVSYGKMVLRLTTQIKKSYCTPKQKQSNLV